MNHSDSLTVRQALKRHHHEIAGQHMRDWFDQDTQRVEQFSLKVNGIHLDYSRNRINKTTLALLSHLSNSLKIHEKIQGLFAGERVNTTEQRPALHTALRDLKQT